MKKQLFPGFYVARAFFRDGNDATDPRDMYGGFHKAEV